MTGTTWLRGRRLQTVSLLLLALSCATSPLAAEDKPAVATGTPHLLKYQFVPGDYVYYDVGHKTKIVSQKNEINETAINESKTLKHLRIVSVEENGDAFLETTIDRVEMYVRFGSHDPVRYNSDQDKDPPRQFRDVQATIGKPLARLKVSARGELISSHPLIDNELQSRVSPKSGEKTTDNDPLKNFLIPLPEKPIRIGETWSDTLSIQVKVGQKLQQECKIIRRFGLQDVKNNVATIGMRMAVLSTFDEPQVRAQLIQRTPSGTILFDLAKGRIISRDLVIRQQELGVYGNSSVLKVESNLTEKLVPAPAVKSAAASTSPAQ